MEREGYEEGEIPPISTINCLAITLMIIKGKKTYVAMQIACCLVI